MKPITQQLAEFLRDQGLFNQWNGPDGTLQDAPILQREWLEESTLSASDRCLLIRVASGGSGDRYSSQPVITFSILGKVSDKPVFVQSYMELVYNALLDFIEGDAIIRIEPLGRIGGPYRMESGRFVYDCEWSAIVETGKLDR